MPVRLLQLLLQVLRRGKLHVHLSLLVRTSGKHLGEKTPARAITRQVVEAKVGRDPFEPAAGGWTFPQLVEVFEGPQEDFLRNVFSFCLIRQQTHSGAKYHVLVSL